ncbi:hypothetical protein [Streptomyces milbemycinicus]|uniref:Uncharacterized protein n=1 Tax=Streptomyces milbemycinicus TaxID=476552 RepID=A0ABW8LTM8_9ACTN
MGPTYRLANGSARPVTSHGLQIDGAPSDTVVHVIATDPAAPLDLAA